MTLRTDQLTSSLPEKGQPMAKKATDPTPYHVDMGTAAHAAMQSLSASGTQRAVGVMDYANVNAQQEDHTPRVYATKPNPKG